jgi:hypothetical protein
MGQVSSPRRRPDLSAAGEIQIVSDSRTGAWDAAGSSLQLQTRAYA